MTTFRGVMRSYNAAVRRAERDQLRRNRASAKAFKQYQKEEAIASAAETVTTYNEYMEVLQSLHKEASDKIDWRTIATEPAPAIPIPTHDQEEIARHKLEAFKPGFFDKLFGLTKGKIRRLESEIIVAKGRDQMNHDTRMEAYQKEKTEWDKMMGFARGVAAQDVHTYKDIIEYFDPFSEVDALGSYLRFGISEEYIELMLMIKSDEVIPKYVVTQTSTGKLSQKNMPVTKFNEVYQDYVCSCVLKVARETLALLPLKFVVVHAIGEMVNSATGRMEEQAVLSVVIYPETLDTISFGSIDPSDCMRNFKHNMKFKKNEGFIPVERLDPDQIYEALNGQQ